MNKVKLRLSLVSIALILLGLDSLEAQEFRGLYVVVVPKLIASPVEAASLRTLSLTYGDTVRVVERPNADQFAIKATSGKYLIRQVDVVQLKSLDKYRREHASEAELVASKYRSYVVTIDSTQAFIGNDRIWLSKGSLVTITGEADSGTFNARIYDRPATISKQGLLEIKTTPSASNLSTAGEEVVESPGVRFSGSAGMSLPVGDIGDFVDPGFSFSLNMDIPLNKSGLYLTFGYTQSSFTSDYISTQIDYPSIVGGFLIALNSIKNPVVAYFDIRVGIDTEYWATAYASAGAGVDVKLSKIATLFVEILPTFTVDPIDIVWMPVRGGIRISKGS